MSKAILPKFLPRILKTEKQINYCSFNSHFRRLKMQLSDTAISRWVAQNNNRWQLLDTLICFLNSKQMQRQDLNRRKFSGMLYKLDESVGLVVEALQRANMLQVCKMLYIFVFVFIRLVFGIWYLAFVFAILFVESLQRTNMLQVCKILCFIFLFIFILVCICRTQ